MSEPERDLLIEVVANVSEGRDDATLSALARACGAALIDLHHDADHHRSVFTLAGPEGADSIGAIRSLARSVTCRIDLRGHDGVHPRLGALDVVPFVALTGGATGRSEARAAALDFAQWWAAAFEVPCFFYDDASPDGTSLPTIRRDAFRTRLPDVGPAAPHPVLGATAVGARRPMVAINCPLTTNDVWVAREIARLIRESSGGLAGVRALGFSLAATDQAQVSMNLVDLDITGVEVALEAVRAGAQAHAASIAAVELVGLVPDDEIARWSDAFIEWTGLDRSAGVWSRLRAGP